jgi:hypothetical protein
LAKINGDAEGEDGRMSRTPNAFASSSRMTLDTPDEFDDISDVEDAQDYDEEFLEELTRAEAEEGPGNGLPRAAQVLPEDLRKPVISTQAKKETDFQRYLSGQSVMKSGLTSDQAEVNRIIAEASKNSKFFLREQAKNEQLNKRIEALMKKVSRAWCRRRPERLMAA